MKKILFMMINMNVGGTEKALLNMLSVMPRDQFDITVLFLEEYGDFLNELPKDIKIQYLNAYSENKDLLNNPPQQEAFKLLKKGDYLNAIKLLFIHLLTKVKGERTLFYKYILKKYPDFDEEFDIAVAYAGPMDFISYYIVNKVTAKHKIQWIHFDVNKIGLNLKFVSKVFTKFDKIFVVSKEGKKKFISTAPQLKDKTEVFPNIISSDLILKQATQDIGFDDNFDGTRILTVGRLTQEKGQELCIKVLKRLKENGYKVRWYCIGEGTQRKNYEGLINQYNLQNDFILLGSKINPYSYMKNCDIYVQPSKHEGYCITLAEIRCFNKPIVTTNFTGAEEQIKNMETGLIVHYDEEEMYTAIKKLLDDSNLAKSLSENLSLELMDFTNGIKKLTAL